MSIAAWIVLIWFSLIAAVSIVFAAEGRVRTYEPTWGAAFINLVFLVLLALAVTP